jgi:hypothetical protein
LAAKVRISVKYPRIDLTPLESHADSFVVEIDKFGAKTLNGTTIELICGRERLTHKIAYEGNAYKIDADFQAGTIKAVY